MSNITKTNAIESALIGGDLSKLNEQQRLSYYKRVCESLGLNELTKPFSYIKLNGKLTLYAQRDATDQLRSIHKVSINITDRSKIGDIYIVTAKAKDAAGREDESTGAVNIANLKGDNLANAMMKAETKAKRRVTLSICGLGILDESEVDSVQSARVVSAPEITGAKEVDAKESDEEKEKEIKQRLSKLGRDEEKFLNYMADITHRKVESYRDLTDQEMTEAIELLDHFIDTKGIA